jgi:hypothetical protein
MKTILLVCQTKFDPDSSYAGGAGGPTSMVQGHAKLGDDGLPRFYNHTHINRMKHQLDAVGAHYDRIVAITNADIRKVHPDIDVIPMPGGTEYFGWWSKMVMYNSNLRLKGEVLFLDLDVMPGGKFNTLWEHNSDDDIVLRRATQLDSRDPSTFLPGVVREGEQYDYLSWIYNTSFQRFNPSKMGALYRWYTWNVYNNMPLTKIGDEHFVAKWLIENSDWIRHSEFDNRMLPHYPGLMHHYVNFGEPYSPTQQRGKRVMQMNRWSANHTVSSEPAILWDELAGVMFGGPWKPWLLSNDSHIQQRYFDHPGEP